MPRRYEEVSNIQSDLELQMVRMQHESLLYLVPVIQFMYIVTYAACVKQEVMVMTKYISVAVIYH